MSDKFSEVLKNQIKRRAEGNLNAFYKEFEALLNRHNLTHKVMREGLEGAYKTDENQDYRIGLEEVFIASETKRFIGEINRLEGYFTENGTF